MSITFWRLWSWRVEARLVAIVVFPTPPFGLKMATTVARRVQSPIDIEPLWMTGPEPSSTVTDRMHIASTRQRIESALYGRLKNSSDDVPDHILSSAIGDITIRAGMSREPSWRRP